MFRVVGAEICFINQKMFRVPRSVFRVAGTGSLFDNRTKIKEQRLKNKE